MESHNVSAILQQLEEIQDIIKCHSCQKQNKVLGRIKSCGHYFCKNCLTANNCPKCKLFYSNNEIDWDNIVAETDMLSNLKELILQAVKIGDEVNSNEKVNTFVYQGSTFQLNFIDEQRKNAKGESPLHTACKKRKIETVETLLKKQVDINIQDFAGWVPLHEAIESESLEIIDILLHNGALVNVPGEQYTTPLHKAVVSQNIEIIKLLLKYGANKDAVDFCGKKPLECIDHNEEIEQLFNEETEIIDRIQHLYFKKKIVPFCYYVDSEIEEKLKEHKVKIEEHYNPKKVSHFIIRKTHKISIKILMAMLNGCMLIPQEWVNDYLKGDYFLPIPNYKFSNIESLNTGIQKAILNHLLKLPKLFDGINFYICSSNAVIINDIKITKHSLISVITAGNGKILHRPPSPSTCEEKINFPYHASKTNAKCCNYIIYEETKPPLLMYNMPELKHKSSKWLIDCAINFTILE